MLTKKTYKNPLSVIGHLNRDFDRFGDILDQVSHSFGMPTIAGIETVGFIPALEAIEKDDRYKINAELPGLKIEDIDISITNDNLLVLKGEKKCCRDECDEKSEVHFQEVSYGSFRREITIPKNIDKELITAESKDGIISITIPKRNKEDPKVKKIDIKSG